MRSSHWCTRTRELAPWRPYGANTSSTVRNLVGARPNGGWRGRQATQQAGRGEGRLPLAEHGDAVRRQGRALAPVAKGADRLGAEHRPEHRTRRPEFVSQVGVETAVQ